MTLLKERIFKIANEPRSVQRFLLRRYLFSGLERLGVHAVGDHFYEPIPNLRALQRDYDDSRKYFPAESCWNFSAMEAEVLQSLDAFGSEFLAEVGKYGFCSNHYFSYWDAICLYTYIRTNRICHIVEIGQGFSTLVSLAALAGNRKAFNVDTKLVSIDPYARTDSQQNAVDTSVATLVRKSAQEAGADEILGLLKSNSLLFVDSSHVFKAGSDVEFLQKELYPKIPSGCHLHIHDIYSPYPWPKANYVKKRLFWNEQDMLEQFLSFNSQFALQRAAYWLHRESGDVKARLNQLGEGLAVEGGSFYLKRC